MGLFSRKKPHEFCFVFVLSSLEEKMETSIFEESKNGKAMFLDVAESAFKLDKASCICILSQEWAHSAVFLGETGDLDEKTEENLKQSINDYIEQNYGQKLKKETHFTIKLFKGFFVGAVYLKTSLVPVNPSVIKNKKETGVSSEKRATEAIIACAAKKVSGLSNVEQDFYKNAVVDMDALFRSIAPDNSNLEQVLESIRNIGRRADEIGGFECMSTLYGLFLAKYPSFEETLDKIWIGTGSWQSQ